MRGLLLLLLFCTAAAFVTGIAEEDDACEDYCTSGAASCVVKDGGNAECICRLGFTGTLCERRCGCDIVTCANNGTCVDDESIFRCLCQPGFFGATCEVGPGDHEQMSVAVQETELQWSACDVAACARISGNGRCDRLCNFAQCNFDGGDCSGGVQPFINCPYPNHCFSVYADGKCNYECNAEACLFDGFDCKAPPTNMTCTIPECSAKYANDQCDQECNVLQCGFDGGDCLKEKKELDEGIVVEMRCDADKFRGRQGLLLQAMSRILRTPVICKKDAEGRCMVYPWQEETAVELPRDDLNGSGVARKKRVLSASSTGGVEAWLSVVDAVGCKENHECVRSSEVAAEMIAAANAKLAFEPLGISVVSIRTLRKRSAQRFFPSWLILIPVVSIVVIGIAVGFINTKTRSRWLKAPVWYPPRDHHSEPSAVRILVTPEDTVTFTPTRLHAEAHSAEPLTWPMTRDEANTTDLEGRTALFWLIANRQKPLDTLSRDIRVLIDAGANVDHADNAGETAFFAAVAAGRLEVAQLLLQFGVNTTLVTNRGENVLHRAVRMDDVNAVRWLLRIKQICQIIDEVDDSDRTPLAVTAFASLYGMYAAELLIRAGADVQYNGNSDTMWRFRGRNALHWAAEVGNVPVMQLLLEHRCHVNMQDVEGSTPLMLAAKRGHEHACHLLLRAGADTEIMDVDGFRPYEAACKNGNFKVAELVAWYANATKEELLPVRRQGKQKGERKRESKKRGQQSEKIHSPPAKRQTLEVCDVQEDDLADYSAWHLLTPPGSNQIPSAASCCSSLSPSHHSLPSYTLSPLSSPRHPLPSYFAVSDEQPVLSPPSSFNPSTSSGSTVQTEGSNNSSLPESPVHSPLMRVRSVSGYNSEESSETNRRKAREATLAKLAMAEVETVNWPPAESSEKTLLTLRGSSLSPDPTEFIRLDYVESPFDEESYFGHFNEFNALLNRD